MGSLLQITHNCFHFHHDDVIKWKHFPRYWPFVRVIHRSPVKSPHKGQWRGALIFSLICAWINGWVNNREAGDLRRHRARYDVIVMVWLNWACTAHPATTQQNLSDINQNRIVYWRITLNLSYYTFYFIYVRVLYISSHSGMPWVDLSSRQQKW